MTLDKFRKLDKKIAWNERYAKIIEEFPSVMEANWLKAFDDIELFGRLLRDILKVEQSQPGRSGPRPVLDQRQAKERLRQFMGIDFSSLPFPSSVIMITKNASTRNIASKTGLNRNEIQRLLAGKKDPDITTMEIIAKAYGKHPSYFLEYRTVYVLSALYEKMKSAPETTIDLYKQLKVE